MNIHLITMATVLVEVTIVYHANWSTFLHVLITSLMTSCTIAKASWFWHFFLICHIVRSVLRDVFIWLHTDAVRPHGARIHGEGKLAQPLDTVLHGNQQNGATLKLCTHCKHIHYCVEYMASNSWKYLLRYGCVSWKQCIEDCHQLIDVFKFPFTWQYFWNLHFFSMSSENPWNAAFLLFVSTLGL